MKAARLHNVANWNAEKGCALLRQSNFCKNHDEYNDLMDKAGRYLRNAHTARRSAWMEEHTRKAK